MSLDRSAINMMVDRTDASRERYVDFLRAFSIMVVVFGHWLMAVVWNRSGELAGDSALALIPWAWALTWVFQVMPLFFFVGGFSNSKSLERSRSYGSWIGGRLQRLMRPTLVFTSVWLGFMIVMKLATPSVVESLEPAAALIAKPLWFLAVYVLVVALAPAMLRLHRRFGVGVLITLVVSAIVIDVARFTISEAIGWLNFIAVWLFAHQLGFFYADGTLTRWARRAYLVIAGGAVGALGLLTTVGPYSKSMVGGPVPGASNNSPPSIVLVVLTGLLVALVLAARPTVSRWLEGRRAWGAVIAANATIMTLYLWHLTALLLASVSVLRFFPQPEVGTASWWALRPVWLLLLVGFTVPFIIAFARFERPARAPERRSAPLAGVSVVLLALGLAGFATAGFAHLTEAPAEGLPLVSLSPAMSALAVALAHVLMNMGRGALRGMFVLR